MPTRCQREHKIQEMSFKKIILKMYAKWRSFCQASKSSIAFLLWSCWCSPAVTGNGSSCPSLRALTSSFWMASCRQVDTTMAVWCWMMSLSNPVSNLVSKNVSQYGHTFVNWSVIHKCIYYHEVKDISFTVNCVFIQEQWAKRLTEYTLPFNCGAWLTEHWTSPLALHYLLLGKYHRNTAPTVGHDSL